MQRVKIEGGRKATEMVALRGLYFNSPELPSLQVWELLIVMAVR